MQPRDDQQLPADREFAGNASGIPFGFDADLDIRVQAAAQATVRSQIPELASEVANQLRAQNDTSDVAKDFFGQSFSQISPKMVSNFGLF